jgi:putative membrane protein
MSCFVKIWYLCKLIFYNSNKKNKMISINMGTNNKFNPWSKEFWLKILIMTIAIWIVSATSLCHVTNPLFALLAALIISLLNAFLKPLISLISMPLVVFTFGLFMLVINAIIVMFTSFLLKPGFEVNGFWHAFWFSIIVTLLSFLMELPNKIKKVSNSIFPHNDEQINEQEKHDDEKFTDYEDVTNEDTNKKE